MFCTLSSSLSISRDFYAFARLDRPLALFSPQVVIPTHAYVTISHTISIDSDMLFITMYLMFTDGE